MSCRSFLTKLSKAGFAIIPLFNVLNLETLRMEFRAYFHSIVVYVIIFWSNATNSYKIFKLHCTVLEYDKFRTRFLIKHA